MTPLFVLPFTPLVVFASCTTINTFMKSLHFRNHHPIMIGDKRERIVTAFTRDDKELGPQLGETITRERARETAVT